MAEFSRFSELPKELQLQTWEAAIPQSPSVHFLSYPQKRGRSHTRCTYQWQRELANANRTINVHKAPVTGEPSMRARTWGRYSSYFASLALLHACHESRRVCLSHTASCKAHDSDGHGKDSSNIVSTDSYTLNLATDIICIQDPIRASLGTSHDTSPCHQDWIPCALLSSVGRISTAAQVSSWVTGSRNSAEELMATLTVRHHWAMGVWKHV